MKSYILSVSNNYDGTQTAEVEKIGQSLYDALDSKLLTENDLGVFFLTMTSLLHDKSVSSVTVANDDLSDDIIDMAYVVKISYYCESEEITTFVELVVSPWDDESMLDSIMRELGEMNLLYSFPFTLGRQR